MKHFPLRWRALTLALLLAASLSAPAQAATESPEVPAKQTASALAEAAQTAALGALEYGSAVSVQYALWVDGEITLSGHTGTYSKTENRALTDDNLYGIGSISKIYTTAAVLRLAEQHRLSLDAPVTWYLPSFQMADARYKDITVRMLLNHSSGLMGSSFQNVMLFDDPDSTATDTLLEQLSTQRLKAAPGAYSVYCNDGFTLAELVVEAVSEQPFMDYVRTNLLAPSGLESTFAPGDSFETDRLANIYQGADLRPLPQDCLNAVGAGGLYASATDLADFGGALTGTSLLSKSSLDAMAAPEYARGLWPDDTLDALTYGLGWDSVESFPFQQSGIQALVKGGDTMYYHAGLIVLPEYHMAAAVLSSGGASTYNELAATRILLAALAAKGVTVDETVPTLPAAESAPMPVELLENAGYYAATAAQYQVSLTADGTLSMRYLNVPSMPAQVFTYHSDGTFRDDTDTAALRFVREDNGETYLYQKAFGVLPGLGTLPISNYAAVLLPENTVSPEVQAFWDQAFTQSALPMREKYSSQFYLALSDAEDVEMPELIPGYAGPDRIVDAETARYELQLPGSGGRDGADLSFFQQDGATWMASGDELYLFEDFVPTLYTGSGWSYSTVQENGYARWYHVGDAAGETMRVQLPAQSGFWVYDADGHVTASSVLWGDTSAVLPEEGLVVFAGDIGARFHLSFTA